MNTDESSGNDIMNTDETSDNDIDNDNDNGSNNVDENFENNYDTHDDGDDDDDDGDDNLDDEKEASEYNNNNLNNDNNDDVLRSNTQTTPPLPPPHRDTSTRISPRRSQTRSLSPSVRLPLPPFPESFEETRYDIPFPQFDANFFHAEVNKKKHLYLNKKTKKSAKNQLKIFFLFLFFVL